MGTCQNGAHFRLHGVCSWVISKTVCVCPGDLKGCVCVCLPVISKALGVCLGGTGLDRSEPMQTLSGEKPCHLPCLVPGPSGDLQRLLQSKPGPASLC